jgi:hypothetical protein
MLTAPLSKDYLTWFWTRDGFLVLTGVVASVGWLEYDQVGKPPKVWVDVDCLRDEQSIDTLRGKSATIDHTTLEVNPDNLIASEVGRVSKVWFDSRSGQQRASVLITNRQLLAILKQNPKIKIGFSPFYYADLELVDGKITQRNRYYNNLSLLFMVDPRGSGSYVFMDAKDKHMSTSTLDELKVQIAAIAVALDTFTTQIPNADSKTGDADKYTSGYEEGMKAGMAYGEALSYADSLQIAYLPTDNLSAILEKVAAKVTGTVVKPGQTPDFYNGMIKGRVNVFSDSTRVDPTKLTNQEQTPAQLAETARLKVLAARYPKPAETKVT